jgi:uncharacterized protein (TIGR00266 family)
MEYEVLFPGSNASMLVTLQPGEKLNAIAGAMVAKSASLALRGHMWGGFSGSLKRSILGGETFYFQEILAENEKGDVLLAPAAPGDIKVISLTDGQDYFVQNGCLLAALENVEMDTKIQKLKAGLFSGAGMFILHLKGTGHIAVSAFGAIMEVPIPAGAEYIINNGHIVAWAGDTEYTIVKAGQTWFSSFASGAGLACKFTGPGKVWVQTRNPKAFGAWAQKYAPMRFGL